MKHKAFGTAAFLGLITIAGCYPYSSEAINNSNYNKVLAAPVFAYVKVGDSTQLILRLVNDINNGALTSYTVSDVGAGIAVHYLSTWRPLYGADTDTLNPTGDKTAQSYYIVGLAPGRYSFKVTPTQVNTGISTTVNVLVHEANLGNVLSAHLAVAGDTVTVTAPAGDVFSQTSAISFASGTPIVAVRSEDSTSISFIVGPGTTGPITVTKVYQITASPQVSSITLVSTDSLVSPAAPTNLGAALSTTTANAGGVVTITPPSDLIFSSNSVVTFSNGPNPAKTTVAADGSSISIVVGPGNTAATASVTKVLFKHGPTLPSMTLATTNTLTTPPVPITLSTVTPAFGATMTVTLGGGLRYLADATVSIGGVPARIISMSADSATATILPFGPTTGAAAFAFTNIALISNPAVKLGGAGDTNVTVGAIVPDPNATSIATASTFTLPAVGATSILMGGAPVTAGGPCDLAGGDSCSYYKVVVGASSKNSVTLTWSGAADLGLYTVNAAGTGLISAGTADAHGSQTGGPETATFTLAPGTYYFAIVAYGAPPPFFQLVVTGVAP